jgi:hypothetical protein
MALTKYLQIIVAKISRSEQIFFFWATLIFYFLSLFNLNNKTIFLSLLILWFIYNRKLRDLRQSLVYTCVATLIFLVGKTWTVQLISPDTLQSSGYPRGYIDVVVITPQQILSFFILAFLLRDIIFNRLRVRHAVIKFINWLPSIFLYLFFLWQLIASFFVNNLLNLPLTYAIQSFSYFILLIGMIVYIKKNNHNLLSCLGAIVVFEALMTVIQIIKRSTLGIPIEAVSANLSYFRGIDEASNSIRSIGTFSHPNELAVFAILTLPIFIPFLYTLKTKATVTGEYYPLFVLAGMVTLTGSAGRSAWLSFIISMFIFLFVVEKKLNQHLLNAVVLKRKKKVLAYGFLLTILFIILVLPRMLKLSNVFKPSGGGESRMRLITESLNIISLNPIWGTGIGLSGLTMFNYNPAESIVATFPAVVHNYYLLLASESGLPALIFFVLFLFTLFVKIILVFKKSAITDKVYLMGLTSVLISVLINGMVQQIFLMGFLMVAVKLIYEKT